MKKWDVYVNEGDFYRDVEASTMEAAVGKVLREIRKQRGPLDGERKGDTAFTRINICRAGIAMESSE